MGIEGDGKWKGNSKEYEEGHARIFNSEKKYPAPADTLMERLLKDVFKNKQEDK